MPTIQDIAKEAGVSVATVSRAFNSPALINTDTHRLIMQTAERMNYRPLRSRSVRMLARKTPAKERAAKLVGFHFFGFESFETLQSNPFYGGVLSGAIAEASLLDIHLVLSSSYNSNTPPDKSFVAKLKDHALQGVILIGLASPVIVDEFAQHTDCLVLVDVRDPGHHGDSLLFDNSSGAIMATQHLIGLGHKRIAFVLGVAADASFNERLDGFVAAHFRAGLPLDPKLVLNGDSYTNIPLESLEACLRAPDRPTAVLAANDHYAYQVLRLCHELGLKVPGDVSVVGFDDLPFSAHSLPPLTTVHVGTEQMGHLAVRRVWERISVAAPNRQVVRIVQPVSLIQRLSSNVVPAKINLPNG